MLLARSTRTANLDRAHCGLWPLRFVVRGGCWSRNTEVAHTPAIISKEMNQCCPERNSREQGVPEMVSAIGAAIQGDKYLHVVVSSLSKTKVALTSGGSSRPITYVELGLLNKKENCVELRKSFPEFKASMELVRLFEAWSQGFPRLLIDAVYPCLVANSEYGNIIGGMLDMLTTSRWNPTDDMAKVSTIVALSGKIFNSSDKAKLEPLAEAGYLIEITMPRLEGDSEGDSEDDSEDGRKEDCEEEDCEEEDSEDSDCEVGEDGVEDGEDGEDKIVVNSEIVNEDVIFPVTSPLILLLLKKRSPNSAFAPGILLDCITAQVDPMNEMVSRELIHKKEGESEFGVVKDRKLESLVALMWKIRSLALVAMDTIIQEEVGGYSLKNQSVAANMLRTTMTMKSFLREETPKGSVFDVLLTFPGVFEGSELESSESQLTAGKIHIPKKTSNAGFDFLVVYEAADGVRRHRGKVCFAVQVTGRKKKTDSAKVKSSIVKTVEHHWNLLGPYIEASAFGLIVVSGAGETGNVNEIHNLSKVADVALRRNCEKVAGNTFVVTSEMLRAMFTPTLDSWPEFSWNSKEPHAAAGVVEADAVEVDAVEDEEKEDAVAG